MFWELSGHFLGEGGGVKVASSNNFSGISECPVQKVLLSAVMLNVLNHVESPSPQDMLLSAVMLNMLNMLNVLGTMRGPLFLGGGGGVKWQFRTIFLEFRSVPSKKCFFQLSC